MRDQRDASYINVASGATMGSQWLNSRLGGYQWLTSLDFTVNLPATSFLTKNSSYCREVFGQPQFSSRPSTSSSFRHIHTSFQLSYHSHLSTLNTHPSAGSDFHTSPISSNPSSRRAGRILSSHLKQHTTLAHSICRLRHHNLHRSIQHTLKTRQPPLQQITQAKLPHK